MLSPRLEIIHLWKLWGCWSSSRGGRCGQPGDGGYWWYRLGRISDTSTVFGYYTGELELLGVGEAAARHLLLKIDYRWIVRDQKYEILSPFMLGLTH